MPEPAASSSKSANPNGASRARNVSGGVQIGVDEPDPCTIATAPPAAVTRASSAKNGIMFRRRTRSNAPSCEGQRGRVCDLEANPARELGGRRRPACCDHARGQVDAHHLGVGKAPGRKLGAVPGSGAQVEDARRRAA